MAFDHRDSGRPWYVRDSRRRGRVAAVMDFAKLPPEVNSGLMYSGPGAGSLTQAAAAWEFLAARLCAAAADYRAVIATLAGSRPGDAPTAMVEAAAPYIDWLDTVAVESERAATQLAKAADAHQTAFTAMVPPPMIAGNRTRRMALVSTNCLSQNSPAIANVDSEYDAMWTHNTEAMYAYADAAATAVAAVTPFPSPPGGPAVAARSWALRTAPEVIPAGRQVMSTIPGALEQLSSSPLTTFVASLSPITTTLSKLNSLTAPTDRAIAHLNSMNKAAALRSLFPKPAAPVGVRAGLGRGMSLGALTVPSTWATAAPAVQPLWAGRGGEHIRLVAVNGPACGR